jgi:hypothetical protein
VIQPSGRQRQPIKYSLIDLLELMVAPKDAKISITIVEVHSRVLRIILTIFKEWDSMPFGFHQLLITCLEVIMDIGPRIGS